VKAKSIGVHLCWNPPPRTAADCGSGHAGRDRRALPSGGEACRGGDAAEWGVEWDLGVNRDPDDYSLCHPFLSERRRLLGRLTGGRATLNQKAVCRDQRDGLPGIC
jgi:hypothetical protein